MENNTNQKNIKRIMFILLIGISIVLMTTNVFAYKLYCLNYGQSLPDAENPRYTCFHDTCQVCTTNLNNPTHPSNCNSKTSCQAFGEGDSGTIDAEAPKFNISSPVEGGVYDSRKVLFDLNANEPTTFKYTDNIKGRGRLKNMARNVFQYFRKLSFKDGLNDITIFGNDRFGNTAEKTITFFVDSKKPRISKTFPRKGFANGIFNVEFKESNPHELTLYYGNSDTGIRNTNLDLDECNTNRGRHYCNINVDLEDYDGQDIEYWFKLEDISGKVANSRNILLSVDKTNPILVNEDYYTQGTGRNKKFIYFNMEVNEPNFDEITYIDNEDSRGREKRICSKLRANKCIKRVSFRPGHHEIDVQVTDEAGNSISKRIEFDV
jgi:hypothetical protein|tara:strand:- start:131 stop:1264 length:1134 start_codon:yes stop_codon:yes gene_type:complete